MAEVQLRGYTLRVATYNVHDCVGRDGAYAPDRIATIIAELRADLVALQEITLDHAGDVVTLLERTTAMQAIEGTLFERGVGRYGNLLLSRAPVAAQALHDISFAGREPRELIQATVVTEGRVCVAAKKWKRLAVYRLPTALPRQAPTVASPWERDVRLTDRLWICSELGGAPWIQWALHSGARAGQSVSAELMGPHSSRSRMLISPALRRSGLVTRDVVHILSNN